MKHHIGARWSLYSIPAILAVLFVVSLSFGLFRQNRVIVDAPSFYAYLPAAIVYKDLKLNFIDKDPAYFKDKIWFYRIEDGRKLIKHPIGFSLVMSPFFLAGHVYAKLSGAVVDGYSMPYQNFMSLGVFIYLAIGLYYLRKVLLRWFSEGAVALTLISLVIGTNLLYYSTFEGLMTHSVSFSLLSACLYFYLSWCENDRNKPLLIFLVLFALVILIRPLSLFISIFFMLHFILSKGIRPSYEMMISNLKPLISGMILMLLIGSVQFIYWKTATGSWLYDVYKNERFIFDSPQIIPLLFSFRKGFFIYSPVLLLTIPGMYLVYKRARPYFWAVMVLMLLTVYIISSWWAWSYGISWGVRPLIDYYCFLAIPFAMFVDQGLKTGFRFLLMAFIFFTLLLNMFQTWQYKNGLIHYDDMSRQAYFKGFFQTKTSPEWVDALKPYNWRRRVNDLPQIEYSLKQFNSLKHTDTVYIRGANQLFVSASAKADFILASYFNEITLDEQYFIYHLNGDTVAIKTISGRFVSLKRNIHDLLVADSPVITNDEKFLFGYIEGTGNQFYLKAANGKYWSPETKFPHIVRAVSTSPAFDQTFRVFVSEDYRKNF